jgi:hypothetical protein
VLRASASFEPFELGLSVVTEDKLGHAFQGLFRAEAQLLRSPVEPRNVSHRDAGDTILLQRTSPQLALS